MKIKIIRIEEPWNAFDDLEVPLTQKQEAEIKEIAKKAFEEFKDFCDD